MSRPPTIGIVDYGVGNLASVWHALHALDFRCRISHDPDVLDATDVLLRPGVGAFPAAMHSLSQRGLDDYLRNKARAGHPLVGICLGMQLLADASLEQSSTPGLGLIPGIVRPLDGGHWHIGWNMLTPTGSDPLFEITRNQAVYFNHSFAMDGDCPWITSVAHFGGQPVAASVRRDSVVGLQFHPEKSQRAGRAILRAVVLALKS